MLHCFLLGVAAEEERRRWEVNGRNEEKRGETNEKKEERGTKMNEEERGIKNVKEEEERQSRLRAVLSQVEDQLVCSFY